MASPKIIFYTNPTCPWAHRGYIALKELGLPYEEIVIDLETPREPWYLEVNPRGLVPALSYNGEIIVESGIVARFLADAHPSHLFPPSGPVDNALYRARVDFFVDAFFSKVFSHVFAGVRAASAEERDEAAVTLVDSLAKEIEPLLEDGKGPFFGGSEKLTLVEVLTGSFLLRLYSWAKPEYGLLSAKIPQLLEKVPKTKRWIEATVQHESVTFIYDEALVASRTKKRFAKA
jgi:glutathione S-transferase